MNRDYIIIIALLVLIIALVIGIHTFFPQMTNEDSKVVISANSQIYEGDSIKIKLTNFNGVPIPNQTVDIFISDKDNATSHHSVVVDENGKAKFKLDKKPGKYTVKADFAGNDYFNGNSTIKIIKVK